MTRVQAKKAINEALRITTQGLFKDDYWSPVKAAFEAVRGLGFELNVTDSEYRHDDNFNPCEKVWKYEVIVEGLKPIYGVLTAHGAGTVADPLSKYDISAYVS